MTVKIIGAGLGRNGTMSTKVALEKLGYRTYHMFELMSSPNCEEFINLWGLAYRLKWAGQTEAVKKILKRLIEDEGYDATLDHPACGFYKELSEMYPEAIVLLNHRDNSEGYGKSVSTTIGVHMSHNWTFIGKWSFYFTHFFNSNPPRETEMQKHFFQFSNLKADDFNPENFTNVAYLKVFYDYWLAKVENEITADRLVKFNVKQGWKPICDKVNIKLPEGSFPRVNDGDGFKKMMVRMKMTHAFMLSWMIGPLYFMFLGKAFFALLAFVWALVVHRIVYMMVRRDIQKTKDSMHTGFMSKEKKN